jgi:hypothetical protein
MVGFLSGTRDGIPAGMGCFASCMPMFLLRARLTPVGRRAAAKQQDDQDASDEVTVAREHVIEDANTLKHLLGMRTCALRLPTSCRLLPLLALKSGCVCKLPMSIRVLFIGT